MKRFVKVDGGIGRCIAITGILKKMGVSVVTTFTSVFDGVLDRVYPVGMPYLYEDHISKGEYLEPEPYNKKEYYKDQEHITSVFNKELTGKLEFVQPEIILSPAEEAYAKEYIAGLRGNGKKKIMLLQPYSSQGGTKIPDETYRSIDNDTISAIIDTYKDSHCILLVKSQGQAEWSGTVNLCPPEIRRVFAVIPHVDVAICCDSFLHHAIAGLGSPIPTIVLWGGTSEKNLGYKEHTNLRIMDVECEPNRVPHNHSYYVNKNKGCNSFLPLVTKIKEIVDGTDNSKRGSKQSTEDSCGCKEPRAKACGNGCGDSGAVHKRKTRKTSVRS